MNAFLPEARTQAQVPICNSIEAGDFKQAQKLVDKRLAKSNDSYLLALKCYIQANHPAAAEKSHAFSSVTALAQPTCKQAITDALELEIYDEVCSLLAKDYGGSEMSSIICRIRIAAVKASPKDEKLALACFRACLQRCNWEYAQQTANLLEKNFPSNHKYPFWKQTTALLLAGSPDCDETKKKIYITLGARTLQAFAKTTSDSAENSALPVKSLQKPNDLLLYHRVLKANNQIGELMDAYKDPKIGTTSKIAHGEWVFKRSQILLLEAVEQWQELFDVCHSLLDGAQATTGGEIKDERGGDWTVWKAYMNAAVHLQTQESHDRVRDQILAHIAPSSGINKTYRRNVSIATMRFAFDLEKNGKSREFSCHTIGHTKGVTPQTASILEYLSKYGRTASAFGDVKEYFERLHSRDQQQLLWLCRAVLLLNLPWAWVEGSEAPEWTTPPTISQTEHVLSVATWTKLSYLGSNCLQGPLSTKEGTADGVEDPSEKAGCRYCSERGAGSGARAKWCEGCHRHFTSHISDYDRAINGDQQKQWEPLSVLPTDIHPGDDLAIVVALSLVKLGLPGHFANSEGVAQRNGAKRFFQAAALLEFAHTKSPANPQISLLLTRLYAVLGAGSLAMRAYNRLNVKQIQGDTLGHMLFDRISSLHPHAVEDPVINQGLPLNPAVKLGKLQGIYGSFPDQVTSNCWRSFDAGSYETVFQLMEAHDRLSRSIGCALSVVELRKILRLTNPKAVFDHESQGYGLLGNAASGTELSNNLDFNSFPNFEPSDGPSLVHRISLGPPPSDFRLRAGLLLEEFWMTVKSPFEVKADIHTSIMRLEKAFKSFPSALPQDQVTAHESVQINIGFRLMEYILASCSSSASDRSERNAGTIEMVHALHELLNVKQQADVDVSGYYPDFAKTLHPLYIAYDAASMAIATDKFLHAKGVDADTGATEGFASVAKVAKELQRVVLDKAQAVQRRMNEGGMIDWLVDSIGEEAEGEAAEKETPGRALRKVLTPEFTECFAGELVDSWKESVVGLAALKEQ